MVDSELDRDPRRHIVSVCFKAKRVDGKFISDSETLKAKAFSRAEIQNMDLAFDHRQMLKDASLI